MSGMWLVYTGGGVLLGATLVSLAAGRLDRPVWRSPGALLAGAGGGLLALCFAAVGGGRGVALSAALLWFAGTALFTHVCADGLRRRPGRAV
ncbi:hypothetical protein GL263_12110 [Streptomyces durbertensis]|uniref:Integral membrane protein n=1 Tax=Streptomyces durbertensis TaxID=2448886 RepID=A0ABR6EG45_9ACTN|nr:hypothetical protein [Streptomyces durbertensis]MBB1244297.1 hypothetical protein [Streptomyces durbertensis]